MAGGPAGDVRSAVARFLEAQPIPTQAVVLVSVSGGQDSVCLLDALNEVGNQAGLTLEVVHVNHRLRGKASDLDAQAVALLASRFGCRHTEISADVLGYARRHRAGIEDSGRNLRYQALASVARRSGAWAAATGHTLDDLAETLLMNVIRGAGSLGASGIQQVQLHHPDQLGPPFPELPGIRDCSPLRVVRPLLGVRRQETEEYCREVGLQFRADLSNLDTAFLRNRVRHHLIPILTTYNPSIVQSLGRLAGLSSDDDRELEAAAERIWQKLSVSDDRVSFDWDDWTRTSAALQRRLLRRARLALGASQPWSFQSLEAARELLSCRPFRGRLSLGGGVSVVCSRTGFRLIKRSGSADESPSPARA